MMGPMETYGLAQIVGYFSVAAVVIAIMAVVKRGRDKAEKGVLVLDRMNFVVRAPLAFKVLGVVCAAFFGFALAFYSMTAADDPAFPFFISVFAAFFAVGFFLTCYSYRWKLVVAEDSMVLTPLFGKDRIYSVREVTHVKADRNRGIRVFMAGKRLFMVGFVTADSMALVSYLIEKGVRTPEKIELPQSHWL